MACPVRSEIASWLPWMRKLALRLTRDPERAADLVQDAVCSALTHAHKFDPARGRLINWLSQIVVQVNHDRRRAARCQKRQHVAVPLDPVALGVRLGMHGGQYEAVLLSEVLDRVDRLSPPQRDALLATAYGATAAEVARPERVSSQAIYQRLNAARERLREACA